MRHRLAGRHLGRSSSHRRALYRNQVTDLLRHEKLVTTEAKAKEVRRLTERMITLGKKGGLHARRRAMSFLQDDEVVSKVFESLADRYRDRQGGYTRVLASGYRYGDSAPMAVIELVERDPDVKGLQDKMRRQEELDAEAEETDQE